MEDLQPHVEFKPIEWNEELSKKDMMSLVEATIKENGLVGHNINGFNDLIEHGINKIMTQLFDIDRRIKNERLQEEEKNIKAFQIKFQFRNVEVAKPNYMIYTNGAPADLYPSTSRLNGCPYSGNVTLKASVILVAHYENGNIEEKRAEIPQFQIGGFPIMIGSNKCHTHFCTKEAMKEMGEDPTDAGGYFIAKRGEYVIDLLENICYNATHIHESIRPNEFVRAEFLSQPGGAFENSSLIRVRLMTNNSITIEINSTKFEKIRLPFYIMYRLFGMTSDKKITETIVFDVEDTSPITLKMCDILEQSFKIADTNFAPIISELNVEKIVQFTGEKISRYIMNNKAYTTNDNAIQYLNEDLLRSLDRVMLPHMGQTIDSRIRKLRYLGLIIHKLLLVHIGIMTPTDRDSYKNKRVHGAGVSLAKAFKTQVNNGIITPLLRAFKKELKNTTWSGFTSKYIIDIFRNAIKSSDLNRAMESAITSGNKTIVIRRRAAINRVSSQALERKNGLNTYSALRTVVTHNAGNASKQTERADMMRRVHSTYTGFICVAQSPDTGENVGMRKQLAITANVCTAYETITLKLHLLNDGDIIPLDNLTSVQMLKESLSRVFLNGEWIGCCKKSYDLVKRYRGLRREGRVVESHTSICWDNMTDEVSFWVDVGRLYRPLLIVDNNVSEYDEAIKNKKKIDFIQNISLTKKHIDDINSGKITLKYLIENGIAEYITPEEQENCLIAESIDVLRMNKNNVTLQFTHCDVEQAIFGLAAHISPFGNHTQPARITLETNQARQTGGWYALNFPFRTDKNRFFQFYNETPLVSTIAHKYIPSNGLNTIIAYASYGGDNQEDSAIVCQASADRGLFAGAFFRYEMSEKEVDEEFCIPDVTKTRNTKPNASYEKLTDNGFIKIGSIVSYGDAIIGKVAKNTKKDDKYEFTDCSIIYRLHEPCVVEGVMPCLRDLSDNKFGIVKLRFERPLRTGDKLCLHPSHKILTSNGLKPVSEITLIDSVACLVNNSLVYQKPKNVYSYHCENEDMIKIESEFINQFVTVNHRFYVKKNNEYGFIFAKDICKNAVNFVRSIKNNNVENLYNDDFIIIAGLILKSANDNDENVSVSVQKYVEKYGSINTSLLYQSERLIPDWCFNLNKRQSRILYDAITDSEIHYSTKYISVVDCLMHLSLNAELSINIEGEYVVHLIMNNEPSANDARISVENYTGNVFCVEVDGGIFMTERNGIPTWTGNSSRSGNKCLTPDHEVLTQNGWVFIDKLDISKDMVATLDNNVVKYVYPDNYHQYKHNDKIITIKGDCLDLKVTCNHRLWVKEDNEYKFCLAKDFKSMGTHLCTFPVDYCDENTGCEIDLEMKNIHKLNYAESCVLLKKIEETCDNFDIIQLLALQCGRNASIINKKIVIHDKTENIAISITENDYRGNVYCITVPCGIFLTRRNKCVTWTGNSIVASMLQQSDMPFTNKGMTPDIIINTHCITGDAMISMMNGTTKRLDTLSLDGGEDVIGWNGTGITFSKQTCRMNREKSSILKITLENKKTLRCTPNHQILTRDGWKEAQLLTNTDNIIMGPTFPFNDESIDERTMAMARLLGSTSYSKYYDKLGVDSRYDVEVVKKDLLLYTEEDIDTEENEHCTEVHFPASVQELLKNTPKTVGFVPEMIINGSLPIVREFLASLFGTCQGIPPQLHNALRTMFVEEINEDNLERLFHLNEIVMLLNRFDLGARIVNRPDCNLYIIHIEDQVGFIEKIGFRYNILNSMILSVAYSYWKSNTRLQFYEFLIKSDCKNWFVITGENKWKNSIYFPHYTSQVEKIENDGEEITYDITVPSTTSFVANGFVVHNSFPSRMTIGQLIETSYSKICARKGVITDGTAFLPLNHETIAQEMVDLGFRYNGRERMYNGMTGEYFDSAIFIGPTLEQRLQKFVLDDEQSVGGSCPSDAVTSQPLGGKHIQGGLRLGEMELWGLESHGAMLNMYEKISKDSDGKKMNICRTCGSFAVLNEYENIYNCKLCGEMADISTIDGSKTAILLHEELQASNIKMKLCLQPRQYEERD